MNVAVVVCAYRMTRQLPNTLLSLGAQRRLPNRVIVVDNGTPNFTPPTVTLPFPVEFLSAPDPTPSPVPAMNLGIEYALHTQGPLAATHVALLLDGANICTPSILDLAEHAFSAVSALVFAPLAGPGATTGTSSATPLSPTTSTRSRSRGGRRASVGEEGIARSSPSRG